MSQSLLVADGALAREDLSAGQAERAVVDVAVGVLMQGEEFLLTSRPGGKLEAGESVEQALRRELQEELGITIGAAQAWKTQMVDYPHALVRLHFCKVWDWQGDLQMREAQSHAWQSLPVVVTPVLPGTVPVLSWLAEERQFTDATHA
jgi:8-oxo-dGTP diphosphatase